MIILKIVAAVVLVILFAAAAWGLTHVGRIRRSLEASDAMPEPVPGTNFLLWLSILVIGLASLLLGYIFY